MSNNQQKSDCKLYEHKLKLIVLSNRFTLDIRIKISPADFPSFLKRWPCHCSGRSMSIIKWSWTSVVKKNYDVHVVIWTHISLCSIVFVRLKWLRSQFSFAYSDTDNTDLEVRVYALDQHFWVNIKGRKLEL